MSRPLWFVGLIKRSFPGRFRLARATHLPLVGKAIDALLFQGDDIVYLPKDQVIPIDVDLALHENIAVPSQVLEYFVQQAHHHWIMNSCICRDSNACTHYPAELGCLFLGEAVLGIDPRQGRLVSRDEALDHLQRCRDAGLVHLVGRNKLDTMWLGVGPGHKLLTICNCCPCCCLWRILPDVTTEIGDKITAMPGVRVRVTADCKGCKLCIRDVCFVDAIHMNGKQAVITDACRGCGRCIEVCPVDAIELTIVDRHYVETTIRRIAPLVELQ